MHLRRLAQQDVERQVYRAIVEMRVIDPQLALFDGLSEHRVNAALAFAHLDEIIEPLIRDREHVAFLAFVAPDFHRRHTRLVVGNATQIEFGAALGVVDQFGQGVGQAAGADIVDRQDRVGLALREAAIDDFLYATLHLRVAALHRGKIETLATAAAGHRRGGAATETD